MKKTLLLLFIFTSALIAGDNNTSDLTIKDVVTPRPDFRMSSVYGTQWTPDGNGYVYLKFNKENKSQDLIYYDIKTGKESIYIDSKEKLIDPERYEKRFSLPQFYWSPADQNMILIPKSTVDKEGVILSSDLYLYNRESKEFTRLTNDDEIERDPLFSPDGSKIAFLKHNNLHVLDIDSKEIVKLTTQGTDKVLVGRFDWVYEEEFGIRTGYEWSPNSDQIAYFELTDAKTDRFPLVDFIPVKNTVEYLPYPKAGADNSTVRIAVVDVDSKENVFMSVSSNKDELIPRIKWTKDNGKLSIFKMNRDQDYLELHIADSESGESKLILRDERKDGWIDLVSGVFNGQLKNDHVTFLEDDSFLWLSRKDGYKHIYHYNEDGTLISQITKGKWEISSINGIDEENEVIYFTAAKNSPLEREFYSVKFNGKNFKAITKSRGYHRINLSPNNYYFLDYYSTVKTAPSVDLMTTKGNVVRNLRKNSLDGFYKNNLVPKELVTFKTEDGTELNGYFIKPKNFDPKKKYPVLMYQYSGPGSQSVKNSWTFYGRDRWHHYLAQNDILVFCTDGRGTGYRGREFEQITNHNLGNWETKDQVSAANYLRSLPFIDGSKIGIWGWSYGGYMSSLAVMKYPDVFNLAIAVAPVTNWKNYDTIYTERFMSTPEKNPNYDKGSPNDYAKNLKAPYLLIHGTGDDNVHLSNAVQLVHELVKHQKQFEHFYYPRSKHGMGYDYVNTQTHLYTMMSNFVLKHFK